MTKTIRGAEYPFCPHCDWKVSQAAEVVTVRDGQPDLKGWAWTCQQCGARGPVVDSQAEALPSLLTRDGVQLKHFRALVEALREHHPDLVEDQLGEMDLEFCECGDLCPGENIYIAEDCDLCPLCLAEAQREAREEGEQLKAKGVFRCRECERELTQEMATGEINEYGYSLCQACRGQS